MQIGKSWKEIDEDALAQAVALLPYEFCTKCVSKHPVMLAAHPELHRNYHASVGRCLARHSELVTKQEGRRNSKLGQWWWKCGAEPWRAGGETRATVVDVDGLAVLPVCRRPEVESGGPGMEAGGVGPQSSSDRAFAARMRLHQSWYRDAVLGLPWGTGPTRGSSRELGSMLRPEDGERGANFLTDAVFRSARQRLADDTGLVEPFRLMCNMLSSQPMCFNLFGPLVENPALATRLWQAALPDEVAEVIEVRIEFAPEPADEYLNDRTAFDAFVDYRRADGGRGFLGIETKLTEPFSQKHYDGPAYRRWMEHPDSPWRRSHWETAAAEVAWNQLWRDHLLAVSLARHARSPYSVGRTVLVRHPGDTGCTAVVGNYRANLKEGDASFIDMPLDRLLALWERADLSDDERGWLAALRRRYTDLDASSHLVG